MNGQESRTCRVHRVRFHQSERVRYSTESAVVESHGNVATSASGERRVKEDGWEDDRPLTSRQSGSAEVSMTPVRRRSADAARRDQRDAASRVAHCLSSEENHYYGPSCGSK